MKIIENKIIFILFFSFLILFIHIYADYIDLESKQQSFVLSINKINIPGHENAFNPSIVKWNNSLLLSFRIYDTKLNSANKIGLIFLNNNFEPISKTYILKIEQKEIINFNINKKTKINEQDPRLVLINNKLKITYSNYKIGRMFIADLIFKDDNFIAKKPICILNFDGAQKNRLEKNWMPFEYQKELLLIYSLQPHKIIKLNATNYGKTYTNTTTNFNWQYGELRGGTPALLVDGEYLSFFHSSIDMSSKHSNGNVIEHFFMGAYTFSNKFPFRITNISPEPIYGYNFYTSKEYNLYRPLKVVFPGGYIFNKDYIWIVFGKQDREIHVVKINKQQLMNSLIKII